MQAGQTQAERPRQSPSSSGSGDGGSRQALLAPGGARASRPGSRGEAKPAVPLRSSRERPRQGVGLGPSSSGGFGNYPSSSGASAAGSGSRLQGISTK